MNQTEKLLIQQQTQQDLIWAHVVDFVQSDYLDNVMALLKHFSTVSQKHWPVILARQHPQTIRSIIGLAGAAVGEAQLRVCQRQYEEMKENREAN